MIRASGDTHGRSSITDDEELEAAEDKLQEYVRMVEENSLFGHGEFLDSVPWEDREDYEDYDNMGQWGSEYDED